MASERTSKSKGINGISLALIMMFGIILMEASVKSASAGIQPHASLAEENQDDLNASLPFMKSRQRRAASTVDPDEPVNIYAPPEGEYEDGKSCENGLEPRPDSAYKLCLNISGSDGSVKATNEMVNEIHGKKCKSKKCHFDLDDEALVCGEFPGIENGHDCVHGKYISEFPASGDVPSSRASSSVKEEYNAKIGNLRKTAAEHRESCKAKKCNLHEISKKVYCTSTSVQPTTILLLLGLTIICLSIF